MSHSRQFSIFGIKINQDSILPEFDGTLEPITIPFSLAEEKGSYEYSEEKIQSFNLNKDVKKYLILFLPNEICSRSLDELPADRIKSFF